MSIGIDIGRVIIAQDTDAPDLFFGPRYLESRAVPGAFEAVRRIVEGYGAERVFLVSKCGATVERKSREWLQARNFFSETGMRFDHLRFVLHRHEKRGVCEELRIQDFVDDRFSVLKHLLDLEHSRRLILFDPMPEEEAEFEEHGRPAPVHPVADWDAALHKLGH